MTVVRCTQGSLFETRWIPFVSFKAVRLGARRVQRCPVHHRWESVERVDETALTEADRRDAARYPAGRLP